MATNLPSTMRAMQWTTTSGGIENNLTLNPSATLPPTATSLPANSTLVKVAYTTINPVDFKVPEMPIMSSLGITKPATPCMDFSGTVVATTRPDLVAGDRVFGKTEPPLFGALAEYLVVGPNGCVKLTPGNGSLRDAAGLGVCGLTAYQTLAPFINDRKGLKVLINGGSGGVGTYTIQLAKLLGCVVTATCSGANAELCRSLGADTVLDYKAEDLVAQLKRQGTQYDLLIDNVNVGGKPIFWQAHHYLKPDGTFVVIAGDGNPRNIWDLAMMFLLPGWLGGGQRRARFVMCKSNAEEYGVLGKWSAEGKLRTVVEEEYEMERAGEAFRRSKAGRNRGKVVIKIAGE